MVRQTHRRRTARRTGPTGRESPSRPAAWAVDHITTTSMIPGTHTVDRTPSTAALQDERRCRANRSFAMSRPEGIRGSRTPRTSRSKAPASLKTSKLSYRFSSPLRFHYRIHNTGSYAWKGVLVAIYHIIPQYQRGRSRSHFYMVLRILFLCLQRYRCTGVEGIDRLDEWGTCICS